MTTTENDVVTELAGRLITFFETGELPAGTVTEDVFLDLTMPHWRVQAQGPADVVAARRYGHPSPGRVPRARTDATATGFVLEWEERWVDGGQEWYCRELARADVRDGRIAELAVYCTGDWDAALQARHRAEVRLLRP